MFKIIITMFTTSSLMAFLGCTVQEVSSPDTVTPGEKTASEVILEETLDSDESGDESSEFMFDEIPDRLTYEVPKAVIIPEIDGNIDLSEWSDSLRIELSYRSFVTRGIGTSIYDLNMGEEGIDTPTPRAYGDLYLKWDDEGLYFMAEMTDDSIYLIQPFGGQGNVQDAIQLCFDPDQLQRQDLTGAYIFDFAPVSEPDHSGPATWYEHFQYTGNDPDANIIIEGSLTDTGYIMEAFMPWDSLRKSGAEFEVQEGLTMGFGIIILDFNDDGQMNDLIIDYGKRINSIGHTETWNEILLAG